MRPITHHLPVRSNMARCCEHAANPQRRAVFTRAEIIRNVRNERHMKNWIAERRAKMFPVRTSQRIANIRALPSIAGFHVVGLGRRAQVTYGEIKAVLRARGFTGLRRGGVVSSL